MALPSNVFFSAHCTGLCGVIIIFNISFLVGGGHQVLHLNVISAVIIIIKLITFVVRQSKKESLSKVILKRALNQMQLSSR